MNKIVILLLVSVSLLVSAQRISNNLRMQKGEFGSLEFVQETDDLYEKIVYSSEFNLVTNDVQREQYYSEIMETSKYNQQRMKEGVIYQCKNRNIAPGNNHKEEYFDFVPVLYGSLYPKVNTVSFEGTCFKQITVTMTQLPSADEVDFVIETHGHKGPLCREWLLLATSQRYIIQHLAMKKTHKVTVKNIKQFDIDEISNDGFRVYGFCDEIKPTIVALFKTLTLFVGGLSAKASLPIIGSHVPEYMQRSNQKFLKESMDWNLRARKPKVNLLDPSLVKSGDFIAIYRLDGLDEIIMWGTGSHIGHSTVALWIEDELFIVESQDAWYWPQHGIQRTPFHQWIEWAHNADFNVALLPLNEAARARWNNDAAIQFFKENEGYPYGYHNFLYSWIDTEENNYPPVIPYKFVPVLFGMLNHLMPTVIESFFLQSLNFRLGTAGLSYDDIVVEAYNQGKTIEGLMAEPEIQGWMYSDGPSYVCSCFVAGVWQAGGLFYDYPINVTEFTPKDIYQMAFFDSNPVLPQSCMDNDPDLPYCQLTGKWKVDLPGYNSIEPYPLMNQNCESIAPEYVRTNGC